MANPMLIRDLALRDVLRAGHNVADQEKFVEQLRTDGRPTKEAENALEFLRNSLRTCEKDLAAADKACGALRSR